MAVKHKAAVGNGKKEGFAEVKAGVPPHGQPEVSSSLEGKGKDQPGNCYVGRSDHAFAVVCKVTGPKYERETYGGRPESNAPRQGVLCVSTKQEFLRQPDKREGHDPIYPPT